jgi:benzoylformate decarboxylase
VYDYLRDVGVRYVFGTPGTNEVPLIDGRSAIDHGEEDRSIDYIPCLHENVAVGAAMGYARGSGVPGVVELHITPGAAHGIGNLYNAFKAHVPLVILCVQQHRDLLLQEPLLESDLVQIARQFTKWAYEVRTAEDLPMALQRAFKVAMMAPTQPVFLSLPWDLMIEPTTIAPPSEGQRLVTQIARWHGGDELGIKALAEELVRAQRPVIIADDGVGSRAAWSEVETLADKVGAVVYSASHSSMMNFPSDSHLWQGELPPSQDGMQKAFGAHDVALLCGYTSQAPVLVYVHENGPLVPPSVKQLYLHSDPWEIAKNGYGAVAVLGDVKLSLQAIAVAVDDVVKHDPACEKRIAASRTAIEERWKKRQEEVEEYRKKLRARGTDRLILGADIADTLARCLGQGDRTFTLVNEAVSDSAAFRQLLRYKEPKDYFFGSGGSLGFSMPASLGFSLAYHAAHDKRLVINVVGDGSALFYPHSWWTATHKDPGWTKNRFDVPVLTIVVRNNQYRTLVNGVEALDAVCKWKPSTPTDYLHLDENPVDYVGLAKAFGLDNGQRVTELDNLDGAIEAGLQSIEKGEPYVLEVVVDPVSHEKEGDPWRLPRFNTLLVELHGEAPAFAFFGPP